MNRGQLKGYKKTEVNANAMIPGLFNESPLRSKVIPEAIKSALRKRLLEEGLSTEEYKLRLK